MGSPTRKFDFSSMNIVKTKLCNKIEDDILMDFLISNIKREITIKISIKSIIDDF